MSLPSSLKKLRPQKLRQQKLCRQELRQQIDIVDSQIVSLLAQRLSLVKKIFLVKERYLSNQKSANSKSANNMKYANPKLSLTLYDPSREKEILSKTINSGKKKGLEKDYICDIFTRILQESHNLQRTILPLQRKKL